MRTFFSRKNSKGFTLVETLVAVSIFSVSILGLFAILTQGTANTAYAKKKITASYLAQEGIEYIRNLRDTNMLYSGSILGWTFFQAKVNGVRCDLPEGCYFDDRNVSFTDSSQPMRDLDMIRCNPACAELRYDVATWKFGYASGVNSGFTRKINVNFLGNEAEVTSTVSWTHSGRTYSLAFSENLFNWAE
jgi:prepilin-type N-terminal cleavage/methylation domain-containing protein